MATHPAYAAICPKCSMAAGVRCENEQGQEVAPHTVRLAAQVTLATDRPGVIVGEPWVLSTICARMGFKNPCAKGRVYLTPDKIRFLGLEVR